jgi:CubicO group peptidase (beta-lactamase class C family)
MQKRMLACFFLLFHITVIAQDDKPAFIKDSLDAYVNKALAAWNIPGAAVCVIKEGKILVMKGYGVTEKGGQAVDENTLFMIGSNSKAFTATAVAQLDAEKKLSLNDAVTKWLPNFKLRDPWVTKNIQVKDLLCHRLGFETFQGDFTYWTSTLTREQVIQKMAMVRPVHEFRDQWGYCNAAFLAAGEIIPKASGMSWENYMREKIFKPLGMTRTLALSVEATKATNIARPHSANHEGEVVKVDFPNIDNLAPAGSISSSVNDMSKWVTMLLSKGKMDGKEIIYPNAINRTREPHSIMGRRGNYAFNRSQFSLYGLGWFLGSYEGREIVAHTGGVNGFVTSVTLVPAESLGIIVFTNTDNNGFFQALNQELLDACLQLPYRGYSDLYLTRTKYDEKENREWYAKMKDTVNLKMPRAMPLSAYSGSYTNELYGQVNITAEKETLMISFQHHPKLKAKLEWIGNNRFFCTYSDATMGRKVIPFVVKGNKAVGFTLTVADFVEITPYEFTRR